MKKKIVMYVLVALILCLVGVTIFVPGEALGSENYSSIAYVTVFSLLPPVVAIALALITKEVYSSLFVGIVTGALLYSNFNLENMLNTMFFNEDGGMIYKLADSWNMGILVFLVLLGILVSLMSKSGGSKAFGVWASKHIKSRAGAQLATMLLGVLIFVDDYFNCLTVGSVMKPVTDRHKVSRAKLAYIIDATAAPVCIIAPISSWAAAVTSSVPEELGINGFLVFVQSIPFNLYAILTLIMIVAIVVMKLDFGSMKTHEANALKGDLFTSGEKPSEESEDDNQKKAHVLDLVLPIIVLIGACVMCMVYTGGFFDGVNFVQAFADSDASAGLVMGGFIALIFTFIYYMIRDVLTFDEFTKCIPEGFKSMISPILILALAWTLSGMTNLLGAGTFVETVVEGSAKALQGFLPVIIFMISAGLAFATGTSWGTFGILIPIMLEVFPGGSMMVISIAACLAGSVCGDHCSPISDTTIMASAGAQCNHVNHVSTQLPYVMVVALVSCIGYALIGILYATNNIGLAWLSLPVSIIILLASLVFIKKRVEGKRV